MFIEIYNEMETKKQQISCEEVRVKKKVKKVKKCPSCGEGGVEMWKDSKGEWYCEYCVVYDLDVENEK